MPPAIYSRFIFLAGGSGARIVVIPSASIDPVKAAERWRQHHATILHAHSREEVTEIFSAALSQATGAWLSGGDQIRLVKLYKGTPVERQLRNLLARGGVIGGTSAGSSGVSNVMVYNDVEDVGFGLTDIVIDQHFGKRKRLDRLLKILMRHPNLDGMGIDENTAVAISGGRAAVMGEGNVVWCRKGTVTIIGPGDTITLQSSTDITPE